MFVRICPRHILTPIQARLKYSTTQKPTQGELLYSNHSNPNHHNLQSFLSHAIRTGLDPQSTTYVGTHYEYTVKDALQRLGFDLRHVGGRSDYGIDLLGTWQLPYIPLSLKVLVQCKAIAKKLSPHVVRELEGAFVGAPIDWRGNGVLGLLVTKNPATKGVREALARSRWPMAYALCTPKGSLLQLVWNNKAEDDGLLGLGVGIRYNQRNFEDKEIQLTWRGEPLQDQSAV